MPRTPLPLLLPLALATPLLLHPPAARAEPPPVANAPYLPGFDAAIGAPTAPPAIPAAPTQAPAPAAPAAAVPPPAPLTESASASDYMQAAAQAVAQQQAAPALEALGRAETRLISRSVPLFQTHAQSEDPAVSQIEAARAAVSAGDFASAAAMIARAMPLVQQEEHTPPPNPPVGLPAAPPRNADPGRTPPMRVSMVLPVEDWRACTPAARAAEEDGFDAVTANELRHDPVRASRLRRPGDRSGAARHLGRHRLPAQPDDRRGPGLGPRASFPRPFRARPRQPGESA